jgi:outer membrane protein assembly factor BamB
MTVNAACGGYRPDPEFHPGEVMAAAPIAGTPLTRVWESRPVRGPSAPIGIDSINAYLGGADRRVVAVDLRTGKTRWSHGVAGPLIGGVVVRGGVIFAASDRPEGKLHAFNTRSGNELWTAASGYVQLPLALIEGRLIALNRKGEVRAYEPATGRLQWQRRLPPGRAGAVALGTGRFLVSSFDSLYVLRLTDGAVLERRRAPGAVVSSWVRTSYGLVAGTGDSLIVSLDADSLAPRWTARVDGPVLTTPAIAGDSVYAVTQLGAVHQIVADSTLTESRRLTDPGWAATGAPAIYGPWLLVGASDGRLRAFSLRDGQDAWSAPLGRPMELAPIQLDDGSLLALGGDGRLERIHR